MLIKRYGVKIRAFFVQTRFHIEKNSDKLQIYLTLSVKCDRINKL